MSVDIVTLINNVGFPIVAFLLMYKLVTETIRDNSKAIRELAEVITRLEERDKG